LSGTTLKIGTTPLDNILFIPIDSPNQDSSYNIWIHGGVSTISQEPDPSTIVFWTDLVQDASQVNNPTATCVSGGWLTSADAGCIFTDVKQAEAGYAYTYCGTSQTCGSSCVGVCPSGAPSGSVCTFDYDPSLKNTKFPYSCTPKNAQPPSIWQQYAIYFIIGIVAFIVVILIFVVIFVLVVRSRKVQG